MTDPRPDEPMHDSPEPTPSQPARNGLGLAGFIVSLVGLCSGGVLSPIGLILSLVAVFRRPRGFAIAGLVIGGVGSLLLIVSLIVGVGVVLAVLAGLIAGAGGLEANLDGFIIRDAVRGYVTANNGAWPAAVADLTGLDADALQDHWGRPYRVELDPEAGAIRLFSDGADGAPDTDDDVTISLQLR